VVGLAMLAGLGAYTLYLALLYDWRGRFGPGDLTLTVTAAQGSLTVALRNNSAFKMIVHDSPDLAGPFKITLTPAAGGAEVPRARSALLSLSGSARILAPGGEASWSVAVARLYPGLPPGSYRVVVAYDPEAAAGRGEACAEDLTLGRVEAQPVQVTVGAAK
jgi:hypothetical protein